MFKLPNIPTAQELLDKSFRRGAKRAREVRSTKAQKDVRARKAEEMRVEVIGNVIESDLRKIVKEFPSYDQLPDFYRELLDIKINKDTYKKSLGAMQWGQKRVQQLKKETMQNIRAKKDPREAKAFLGRVSSIVNRISPDLERLLEIKKTLKEFPMIKDEPTLVIAGYPNAGKSTFMRTLTGSKVKIATYPFTTKDLLIGHKKIRHQTYQIIDSPGLLDRKMDERNPIELQAMLAMKKVASHILVMIDPNMDLPAQLNLLQEIITNFESTVYVAINKIDITEKDKIEKTAEALAKFDVTQFRITATRMEDTQAVFEEIFKKPKETGDEAI